MFKNHYSLTFNILLQLVSLTTMIPYLSMFIKLPKLKVDVISYFQHCY